MVGSIKNFTGQRVDMSKGMTEGKVQSEKSDDSSVAAISGSKVDAVLTSKSREALKVMAENPSINMEAVERIKQKIKNGEYPIDFDKLADKLLESYWNSES
jgi:flagellar biosynthesis anti-sigma factor FlgM